MVGEVDSRDAVIAAIAERQHGVATASQLREASLSDAAISKRVRAGRLRRIHRGVYAVGHGALSREGRWIAAVLACGKGAVVSHASAAALWGLLRPIEGPIDISVPTTAGRARRRGLRIHRCATLMSSSSTDGLETRHLLVTRRDGIPVTTVARTLRDLRGAVAPYLVRRATRQAELAGWRLDGIETDRTRSDLERDFLCFCRRHRLPSPKVNARVADLTVDFLWPDARLVVETDGYRYHRGSIAFENDHARDLTLRQHGFTVLHYTGAQLRSYPAEIAAELGEVLARAPVPSS